MHFLARESRTAILIARCVLEAVCLAACVSVFATAVSLFAA